MDAVCFVYRLAYALDAYRGLSSMSASVSTPGTEPNDHEHLSGDPLSEHAVCCMRKSSLFHRRGVLWDTILPVMKKVPK